MGELMWLITIVGGTLFLGIALAFGVYMTRHRSASQVRESEEGARRMYNKPADEPHTNPPQGSPADQDMKPHSG